MTELTIPLNDGRKVHVATGGEAGFSYDYPLYDESHIKVEETDASGTTTALVLNTDYTVTGVGVQPGVGTLEIVLDATLYPSGATAGDVYTLSLDVPESRESDYNQAGDFLAPTLNKDFDLTTQQIQQLRRDIERCLRLASASQIDGDNLVFPETTGLLNIASGGVLTTVDLSSLSEAIDLLLTGLANNDFLKYDSASGFWINRTPAEVAADLSLEIGTDVQAWDAQLDALSSYTVLDEDDMASDSASGLPTQQSVKAYVDARPGYNYIRNPDFAVAQRGTSFTSATSPANNDDTYLFDGWILLSDGNDIVDVSQETSDVPVGSYSALKIDQETANKQWGILQVLEAKDAKALIDGVASLSFSAKKGGSNATLGTLRMAIVVWDSTADAVTSDAVGTWAGAGTNPTLATNWTYESTPVDLTLTTSYQTFSVENVSIDTASAKNVGVHIWCDDTDATVADLAYISQIKLEKGANATPYSPRSYSEEENICQRFFERIGGNVANESIGVGHIASATTSNCPLKYKKRKRVTPTITVSDATDFTVGHSAISAATTALSAGNISVDCCFLTATFASIGGFTNGIVFNLAADSTGAYLDISAEL